MVSPAEYKIQTNLRNKIKELRSAHETTPNVKFTIKNNQIFSYDASTSDAKNLVDDIVNIQAATFYSFRKPQQPINTEESAMDTASTH